MYVIRVLLVIMFVLTLFVLSVGVGLWDNTIHLPQLVTGIADAAMVVTLWYTSWEKK